MTTTKTPKPLATARVLLATLAIGALVPACTDGTRTDNGSGDPDGGAIYVSNCASCHGDAGEGGIGVPLDDLDTTPDQVRDTIADGATGMPAYGNGLTAAELDAVVDYTLSLRDPD